MKLTIHLYGITRDIAGGSKLEVELAGQPTTADLLGHLKSVYPQLGELKSLLVAVNEEYAEGTLVLQERDDIALIPPVSGG